MSAEPDDKFARPAQMLAEPVAAQLCHKGPVTLNQEQLAELLTIVAQHALASAADAYDEALRRAMQPSGAAN